MYFESHAHYDDKRFDEDRDILLSKTLPEASISHLLNCGADMPSSKRSVALSAQYDYIYAAVGVHPHDAENMHESDFAVLAEYTKHKKVVAIGEIGLDYYYDNSPREIQVRRFKDQLNLALDLKMPVIIHSREAANETFGLLKASGIGKLHGGVIHCYSGSAEMAMEYVKMGFHIGIGGVVTFNNSRRLQETTAVIPMESILIETDCPYLAPVPNRGQRNDSQNLKYITDKIAQIRQISHETVAISTKENALRLFFLK